MSLHCFLINYYPVLIFPLRNKLSDTVCYSTCNTQSQTQTHCSYSWRNAPCTTNNRVVCRISDDLLTHDCGLQPHSKAAASCHFQESWDCDPLFQLASLWEDIFTASGTQWHICSKLTLTKDSHNYYYETLNSE